MPSGADLEYARLLAAAGQTDGAGLDGARLEQLGDEQEGKYVVTDAFGTFTHVKGLRKWYSFLSNRYSSTTNVLVMGDSNSEGTAASVISRRWQQIVQSQLRSRYQPEGVVGATIPYITSSPRTNPKPSDYPVVSTGGPVNSSFGLGLRACQLDSSQTLTWTFTGDRCKIVTSRSGATGRYQITLDANAPVVLDSWSGSGQPTTVGNVFWDSGIISRGVHTVKVTRDVSTTISPGYIYPEGLLTYDGDHDKGIRVFDGARHGAQVEATFNINSGNWKNAITNLGPFGLCIMPWGANDASAGVSSRNFGISVRTLIEHLRSSGFDGSILLVGMPKRGNAVVTEKLWSAYRLELQNIANSDSDIVWFDLRNRMPDYSASNEWGLYYDEVHYVDKGQVWIADQISNTIFPH